MDLDGVLIAASSTIIGIVLGTLISSVGYYVRLRKDRNRLLNECLFKLMEIWHLLSCSLPPEPNIFLKKILEGFSRKIPQFTEISVDDKKQLTNMINQFLPSIFSMIETVDKVHGDIARSYAEVITTLSREDPFLAYKISSHADFPSRMAELKAYLDNVNAHIKTYMDNEADTKLIDELISSQYRDAKLTLLKDIETDLLSVGLKIGKKQHKKLLEIIKNQHSKDEEVIDELVDGVLNKIMIPVTEKCEGL